MLKTNQKKDRTPRTAWKIYFFILASVNIILIGLGILAFVGAIVLAFHPVMGFYSILALLIVLPYLAIAAIIISAINIPSILIYKKRFIPQKAWVLNVGLFCSISILLAGASVISGYGSLRHENQQRENDYKKEQDYYNKHPISKDEAIKLIRTCKIEEVAFEEERVRLFSRSTPGYRIRQFTAGDNYPDIHKAVLTSAKSCKERVLTTGDYYPYSENEPIYITLDEAKKLMNSCVISGFERNARINRDVKNNRPATGIVLFTEKDPSTIKTNSPRYNEALFEEFQKAKKACPHLEEIIIEYND